MRSITKQVPIFVPDSLQNFLSALICNLNGVTLFDIKKTWRQ